MDAVSRFETKFFNPLRAVTGRPSAVDPSIGGSMSDNEADRKYSNRDTMTPSLHL